MRGARISITDLHGKAVLGLLAIALLMRLLVPTGWMPMAGSGYAITLCTGMGAVQAWVDKDGNVHKGKPTDTKSEQPCAFSGYSLALDLPPFGGVAILPALPNAVLPVASLFAVDVGRGLAAPPPPPTGPPATR